MAYLPQTLRIWLSELFTWKSNDLEIASIGQCIVQKTRPRTLNAPLQFGLGNQMHHLTVYILTVFISIYLISIESY